MYVCCYFSFCAEHVVKFNLLMLLGYFEDFGHKVDWGVVIFFEWGCRTMVVRPIWQRLATGHRVSWTNFIGRGEKFHLKYILHTSEVRQAASVIYASSHTRTHAEWKCVMLTRCQGCPGWSWLDVLAECPASSHGSTLFIFLFLGAKIPNYDINNA